ncbi:MAG: single-stranded-DNA-specific exonuclease RecJ [Flavobacteriaceae bacterium]|nr:single-stranded-DNA-specific exonuclease RecJ [Flavobacteriaceae bacterium]
MNWVEEKNIDFKSVKHLSNELKINSLLSAMLVRRNIKTYDQAKTFFRPKFEDLHDPFLMKDMDVAFKRLKEAIINKEKVMVFGDYDVDGTSSVAMMSLYLESKGIITSTYLPERNSEGYGISIKAIDIAFEQNIKLIIALDCGIKAHKQISYAKEKDIEFIICDHHNPSDKIPEAYAVLNPKRLDCDYPFKELCGCGVGFKLIQALEKNNPNKKEIINYLDLVALAISADVVPLIDENRIMSYLGLQIINSDPKPGIHSLLKSNPKKEYVLSDLMFYLAPRINAAGRVKHAKLASDLLACVNESKLDELTKEIEELNSMRKLIEKEMTQEAIQQAETCELKKSIIVSSSNWNKGVIGIVAARLVDKFYKPSLVFSESENGFLTASARSIKGINLYKVLEDCNEYIEKFGGHKYAAGLSIKKENLEKFKSTFDKAVEKQIDNQKLDQELLIESTIELEDITPKFFRILKQFEPFGPGNRMPVFKSDNLKVKGKPLELGDEKEHIKLNLTQNNKSVFSSIGFFLSSKFNSIKNKSQLSVAYTIEENHWNGNSIIQLKIKDMK